MEYYFPRYLARSCDAVTCLLSLAVSPGLPQESWRTGAAAPAGIRPEPEAPAAPAAPADPGAAGDAPLVYLTPAATPQLRHKTKEQVEALEE